MFPLTLPPVNACCHGRPNSPAGVTSCPTSVPHCCVHSHQLEAQLGDLPRPLGPLLSPVPSLSPTKRAHLGSLPERSVRAAGRGIKAGSRKHAGLAVPSHQPRLQTQPWPGSSSHHPQIPDTTLTGSAQSPATNPRHMHQHTEAAEPGSEQQYSLANTSTHGKINCSGPHKPLVEGCSLHSGTGQQVTDTSRALTFHEAPAVCLSMPRRAPPCPAMSHCAPRCTVMPCDALYPHRAQGVRGAHRHSTHTGYRE